MGVSKRILLGFGGGLALVVAGVLVWHPWKPTNQAGSVSDKRPKIIINEAARTLLYLPLYHAQRAGYFAQEGVDVEIVTGGSATNAVAAIVSGNADIAQADPMYAPISQSKGADLVVIGQIVGRIGLWALERPGNNLPFDRIGLNGATIITHPKPMTSHTYAEIALRDNGLKEADATFIEAKPGTEVATYTAERRAQFIITVEPVVSILQGQGAKIVYSWPDAFGDRVFSGLMVRRATLMAKPDVLRRILRAYQHALNDIAAKNPTVTETARIYFPNLAQPVLGAALHRLVDENVFPKSLQISEASWANAVNARREAGEISGPASYQSNVELNFIRQSTN